MGQALNPFAREPGGLFLRNPLFAALRHAHGPGAGPSTLPRPCRPAEWPDSRQRAARCVAGDSFSACSEHVTFAADGEHNARLFGIVMELFTEIGHVHI